MTALDEARARGRITPAERAQMRAMRREGATVHAITVATGRSEKFVARHTAGVRPITSREVRLRLLAQAERGEDRARLARAARLTPGSLRVVLCRARRERDAGVRADG